MVVFNIGEVKKVEVPIIKFNTWFVIVSVESV
jgi:hypothetical protein